jgi:hypothetical protein
MLAEPAASIARQDGVEHVALTAATLDERVDAVLATGPTMLLLGTSVQSVVERALTRRIRAGAGPGAGASAQIPTLAVLDAMLFVERRFGAGLAELPDLVACPDEATASRLQQARAPAAALVVTGNPTLEEIWLAGRKPPTPPPPPHGGREGETSSLPPLSLARGRGPGGGGDLGGEVNPIDILFVSSPVAAMRLRGAEFTVDERQALADLLTALSTLPALAPSGYRVRVRLHPVQRSEPLPVPPPGITLEPDDDPDRLRSCARARLVVGLSSTLLGEARFLPRSAIAYLPGPFWEQERVFAPEYGVHLARSRDHFQVLLARALREPTDPPPLAGHLGAAGRIADLLRAFATGEPSRA